MIGGNIPGQTRTVSISIYDEVQSLNYSAANQTSLALLIFALPLIGSVPFLTSPCLFQR
jgi:molybdate transport system permease protein